MYVNVVTSGVREAYDGGGSCKSTMLLVVGCWVTPLWFVMELTLSTLSPGLSGSHERSIVPHVGAKQANTIFIKLDSLWFVIQSSSVDFKRACLVTCHNLLWYVGHAKFI